MPISSLSSGEWRRGRDALVKGTMASSARTTGTRTVVVETIRMVGPDVAIADGRYEISGVETQEYVVDLRDGPPAGPVAHQRYSQHAPGSSRPVVVRARLT